MWDWECIGAPRAETNHLLVPLSHLVARPRSPKAHNHREFGTRLKMSLTPPLGRNHATTTDEPLNTPVVHYCPAAMHSWNLDVSQVGGYLAFWPPNIVEPTSS